MNWYATKHTRSDRFPGENKLGKVLMEVRESITKAMTSPEPKRENESRLDSDDIQTVPAADDNSQVITVDGVNTENEVQVKSVTETDNTNIDNNVTPKGRDSKSIKPNGTDDTKKKAGTKRLRSTSGHTTSPPSKQLIAFFEGISGMITGVTSPTKNDGKPSESADKDGMSGKVGIS